MTLIYDETRARLTIYEKTKRYVYTDVPLCVFNKLNRLYQKGFKGKVWQEARKYEEEK